MATSLFKRLLAGISSPILVGSKQDNYSGRRPSGKIVPCPRPERARMARFASVATGGSAAYASINRKMEETVHRVVWLLAFCLAATIAQAETYPNKPIRMIVPFPAGAATDGQARLIGAHFQKAFGQSFIVENMPGATGAIAARTVARAAPDGYT